MLSLLSQIVAGEDETAGQIYSDPGNRMPHLGRSLDSRWVTCPKLLKWNTAEALMPLCETVALAESAVSGSQDRLLLGSRAVGKKTASDK